MSKQKSTSKTGTKTTGGNAAQRRAARRAAEAADRTYVRPAEVNASKYNFPTPVRIADGYEQVAIWPDTQIGYRLIDDELDPLHDERAMRLALNITAAVRPQVLVHLGDTFDLAEFSDHFTREPPLVGNAQATFDRGARMFTDCARALTRGGKQVWLKGNHEARFNKWLADNAPLIFGLKDQNDRKPLMDLDRLVGATKMGIETIDYRPGGLFGWWLNTGTTLFTHGDKTSSSGSTAALYANQAMDYNIVFGHIHSQELHWVTKRMAQDRCEDVFAASPGALCRRDGAVPGFSSTLAADGSFKDALVDWQQGMAVITYEPGVAHSEHIDLIKFMDNPDGTLCALYNGKVYTS